MPRHHLRFLLYAAIGALLLLGNAGAAVAGSKKALVIGNASYQHLSRLRNPGNDARLMAATLRNIGFDTTEVIDLGRITMSKKIRDFAFSLKSGDIAVFYYAGHAVQVDGKNYLLPVDAKIANDKEVPKQSFRIDDMINRFAAIDNMTKLIILDACRDNPFAAPTRSVIKRDSDITRGGLARMDAPPGASNFYIAYSTAPGAQAYDGGGTNSPYTEALARELKQPGVSISAVFNKVRQSVIDVTRERGIQVQIPWESTSMTADLVLVPQALAASSPAPALSVREVLGFPAISSGDPGARQPPPANSVTPSPSDSKYVAAMTRSAKDWNQLLLELDAQLSAMTKKDVGALIKKADRGDVLAQTMVANMYLQGELVPRAPKKALKYFRAASDQSFAMAQHQYGRVLTDGEIVERDFSQAAKLFEEAAAKNYTASKWSLGYMYLHGIGVPRDLMKAQTLMQDAAQNSPLMQGLKF